MWNGYLASDYYYQRPILDRIRLWSLLTLWYPLRALYVFTGESSSTLLQWESMLYLRAAKYTPQMDVVWLELKGTKELVKKSYTISLGDKLVTFAITNSENISSGDMEKLERMPDVGYLNDQEGR